MLKQNKGITLVALVITIIVLLILAGVSISLVVGDNGILTQSKGSSDATKIGQMQEALQIAMSDTQTAYFADYSTNASTGFDAAVNQVTLAKSLKNQGYELLDSDKHALSTATYAAATHNFAASDAENGTVCYIADENGNNRIKVVIKKSSGNMALTVEYPEKDSNGKVIFNKD